MRSDLSKVPGSAGAVLSPDVALFHPQESVFAAMMQGWRLQQQSRQLRAETIASRLRSVTSLQRHADEFPWNWTPAMFESFVADLTERRIAVSTIRHYQGSIRLFLDFLTDRRYQWLDECDRRFGVIPMQICTEWNTVHHSDEYEGQPSRRPLAFDELQRFFDQSDARVRAIRLAKKKGGLAALRDTTLFKVMYGWGLRNREVRFLDLADLHSSPAWPAVANLGALHVRYGKSSAGGAPRRRLVLSVPHFDWAVDALKQYLTRVRPLFDPGNHPGLFISERRGYLSADAIQEAFGEIIRGAGLDQNLEPHCLRHSYATHLAEYGYDREFIRDQVGHTYASTTAIYTHVSSDFKQAMLKDALASVYRV